MTPCFLASASFEPAPGPATMKVVACGQGVGGVLDPLDDDATRPSLAQPGEVLGRGARVEHAVHEVCDGAPRVSQGRELERLGDAVLAVFGAPLTQPDHQARAARAALMMRRAIAGLNLQPPVTLRIARSASAAGSAS